MPEKTVLISSIKTTGSGSQIRTLDAAAAAWLRSTARVCKVSTRMNYTGIYNRRISPVLGGRDIRSLKQEDLQKLIFENPVLNGETPSPVFVHKTCREFFRILEFSGEKEKAAELMDGLLLPAQKRKPVVTFTPYEQRKLTAWLLENLDESKLGILFCLMTGVRLGEACAVRTSDISLENEVVHICRTVQRVKKPEDGQGIAFSETAGPAGSEDRKTVLIITDPKTEKSDRYIPLHADLLRLLREKMPDTRYLIHGNEVMDPRTYEYRFYHYQIEAGIRPKKFHVLRHTFATNCVAGGMSPKVLSEILGHSSVTTTMALYVHPTLEMKKKQLDTALNTLNLF